MRDILISDVVCATNGKVDGNSSNTDDYISNITTNSKECIKGSLFIAIRGGHNFVQEAVDNGAICCLVEKKVDVADENVTFIYTEDTVEAMLSLATFYRSLFNIPAVAITGSSGKTSTKDIVASVLGEQYNVLKTEGNFNNEIGVPMTIFNLRSDHEMLVIEMGMNHFGEIEKLVDVVKPDVAIITNIGVAHIEHLGSKEGILKAKLEITSGLKSKGTLIINKDDEMLGNIANEKKSEFEIMTFSKKSVADYKVKNVNIKGVEGITFDVENNGDTNSYQINYPGEFMVSNAVCAIICGDYFDIDQNKIIDGIKNFTLSKNRLERFYLKTGATVINDAYNASPDAMHSSITILDDINDKRKILVLGDMFELGEESAFMHKELGKFIATKKVDIVIFCGEMMKNAYSTYNSYSENQAYHLENIWEISHCLEEIDINKNDIILFKASNGMKFKEVINEIKVKM